MSNNIELEIKELKQIIYDSESERPFSWGLCCFCKNKMSFDNPTALNGSNKVCMNCYRETRSKLIDKQGAEILRLKNKLSRVIRRLNSINEIINND